jgi:diketogulonate reductase-like aldo/keto reductase
MLTLAHLFGADNSFIYGTESIVGEALAEASIPREELYVTTKFDNFYQNETFVERTFQLSLNNLGVDYVDLLLIHFPQFAKPVGPVWREFEGLVERGLVRSIGVSNYNSSDLQEILDLPRLKIKPAVNQIKYHPYSKLLPFPTTACATRRHPGPRRWSLPLAHADTAEQNPTVEFNLKHDIVTQAYSALTPLTKEPGGPVSAVAESIADQLDITDAQVILDWVKEKGLASVT